MKIPEQVQMLLQDKESVKVLSSVNENNIVHSVVIGSIMPLENNLIGALEIFMNTSANNIKLNDNASILITKEMESYLIVSKALERHTEGELYDQIAKPAIESGFPVRAVWVFEPQEIFDQSATPNAGTKLA